MSVDRDLHDFAPLARRLTHLNFPEAAEIGPRVIQLFGQGDSGRAVRRGRWPRRLALAAVVLLLVVGALAALPSTRQALADAPIVGPFAADLLRLAGLPSVGPRISHLDVKAVSSDHTVSLVGAYADNSRTVVIVHVDPARMPELPVTLTDDKGVSLTEPVISPTEKGDVVLTFGAIPNPSPNGNPLTLDIEELGPILTVSGPVTGDYGRVEGQWILHFTIKVDAQAAIPPLAPGQLGQVKVSFQETVVGTDVQVSAHLTGATIGQLEDMASDDAAAKGATGQPGPGAFQMSLLDGSGRLVKPVRLAIRNGGTRQDFVADFVWSVPGPGTYRLSLAWKGHQLDRSITVKSTAG